MKVSGHSMNHSYSRQAKVFFDESQLIHEAGVKCTGDVFVSQTFIEYGGEETCHRPYFVLIGRLEEIHGEFPEGITDVEFPEADQPEVRMNYELTNRQIADMYERGVFPDLEDLNQFLEYRNNKFGVRPETVFTPDIMNLNRYEGLPMDCSVLVVKNVSKEDAPIIFVQPEKQFDIPLTAENSGYELNKYMNPFVQDELDFEPDKTVEEVDESVFEQPVVEEEVVEERELTDDEKMAAHIFGVTKPRVDKHVEEDKEQIALAKEAMNEIEDEADGEEFSSDFEKMMLTEEESDDEGFVSEEELDEEAKTSDGPLSVEDILARKRKAQRLADKVQEETTVENEDSKNV